jgi:hypothetical protein
MKRLVHMTAAALMGWYLMVPPRGHPNAPMASWHIEEGDDSAQACNDDWNYSMAYMKAHPHEIPNPTYPYPNWQIANYLIQSKCMDGNDLRSAARY